MRKFFFFLNISLLFVVVGCDNKQVDKDKIIFGISADYPPFEYHENNDYAGFDIELAQIIADKLGKTAEFKEMNFGYIFQSVYNGKIDAGISTISSSSEREKNFSFSTPYYHSNIAILYHTNLQLTDKSKIDRKKIAVQTGTIHEYWAKKNIPNAEIRLTKSTIHSVEALKSRHVEAVLLDEPQAQLFVNKNNNLSFSLIGKDINGFSILMSKNSSLKSKIDPIIHQLINDGTIYKLEKKYLKNLKKTNFFAEFSFSDFFNDCLYISKGILYTLKLSALSLILGICLALSCLPWRNSFFIGFLLRRLISIIRGTPLILQLSIIYYSGFVNNILLAGVITFGLNSFAYVSEIFRAGMASIPQGQFEAAQTLKISKFHMYKSIIIPQVLKNTFPAMINETVTLLKESAIISVIGALDIMKYAEIIGSEKFLLLPPLFIAGLYYYSIVLFIEFLGEKFYKKINAQN